MATRHLHAKQFDGNTFGMEIETKTKAFENLKKSLNYEECITYQGNITTIRTVPYLALAAVMREAHWLVSEIKNFNYVTIEGLKDELYVKYNDSQIDFRKRIFQKGEY